MPLVQFTFDDNEAEPIAPPPPVDNVLAGASWLYHVLLRLLYEVMTDDSLTEAERRDDAAKLATKITQATPNHEVYQARKKIADDERKTETQAPLGGKVAPSASTRHSGHLRADAPRGRAKSKR